MAGVPGLPGELTVRRAAVVFVLVVAALTRAQPAQAATITFVAGVLDVDGTTNPDVITITRQANGAIAVDGDTAHGADVNDTSSIIVDGAASSDTVIFDLQAGLLAPGAGLELDAPEIEVDLTVESVGIALPDSVPNSVDAGTAGLNLNGDGDIDVVGHGTTTLGLEGGAAADDLNLRGGTLTGAPWSGETLLRTGAGRDRVVGGDGPDEIEGGDGSDTLIGRGGKDHLLGQEGNDRLVGGSGRDKAIGGRGIDECSAEVVRSC